VEICQAIDWIGYSNAFLGIGYLSPSSIVTKINWWINNSKLDGEYGWGV